MSGNFIASSNFLDNKKKGLIFKLCDHGQVNTWPI